MASDEQRSPWLPVQPEGQPHEDVPTPADATHEAPEVTGPPTALPPSMPSFDDILAPTAAPAAAPTAAPESGAPSSERPFGLTPSRPSLLRPPAPTADVAAPDASPAAPAAPAFPSAPPAPVLSPYLTVERPAVPSAEYERPVETATPVEYAPPIAEAFTATEPPSAPAHVEYASSVEYAPATDSAPVADLAPATDYAPVTDSAPPVAVDPFLPSPAPALPSAPFAPAAPTQATPTSVAPTPPAAAPVAPTQAAPIPFAPWTAVMPAAPAFQPPAAPAPVFPPPAPPWENPQPQVLVGGLVPTPIEAEEGDIFAPIPPPDAAEIQPRVANPFEAFAAANPVEAPTPFTPQHLGQEYVPEATDAVRQLGAAALSAATFEAAGAPTPRGGLPIVQPDGDQLPAFGEEDPFVPRFEPMGGVVSAPVPTVSFTTPVPPVRPTSPLSDLKVPESDEPAYIPQVDYADHFPHVEAPAAEPHNLGAFTPPAGFAPASAPASEPAPAVESVSPARPWSPVDPADVEFAGGTPFAAHSSASASGAAAPVEPAAQGNPNPPFAPPASSWDGIMGGTETPSQAPEGIETATPASEPTSWSAEAPPPVAPVAPETPAAPFTPVASEGLVAGVAEAAATHPAAPVTPVASFFAAASARSPHRGEDAAGEPTELAASEAIESPQPHDGPEATYAMPSEVLDEDAAQTLATPYTQSQGEWSPPALSAADAVTQVTGFAPVNPTVALPMTQEMPQGAALAGDPDQGENLAANSEVGEDVPLEPQAKKRGRGRLVLWIVLAAIIAAGAGVLVYRLYFLPEPIILPAPTVTAPAATPTAEPTAITDASDFVKAMPTTVGTNVLIDYTVTDPVGDASLPARAAEHVTLTYGPGSASKDFTVEAYQHYNVDDAQTAYDTYATGATDVKDVTVGGAVVGKRAFSTKGSDGTVVWRNGTVVFDLNGPADKVLGFFEHFGL